MSNNLNTILNYIDEVEEYAVLLELSHKKPESLKKMAEPIFGTHFDRYIILSEVVQEFLDMININNKDENILHRIELFKKNYYLI